MPVLVLALAMVGGAVAAAAAGAGGPGAVGDVGEDMGDIGGGEDILCGYAAGCTLRVVISFVVRIRPDPRVLGCVCRIST